MERKQETIHQTQPIYLVEKIIRTRIYQSLFWKESCFGLSAETILDKAVELASIGGQYSNQKPTNFLCLVLKLLQLVPEPEIALFYVQQPAYKYLRALGAFYYRLTAPDVDIFTNLEPLLYDRRKLRMRTATGFVITHMDEFVDALLTSERYCDIILPRMKERYILEDLGLLEPRVSTLEAELEEEELALADIDKILAADTKEISKKEVPDASYDTLPLHEDKTEQSNPSADTVAEILEEPTDPVKEAEARGWSKKKIKGLFKKDERRKEKSRHAAQASADGVGAELSTDEVNKVRKSLGLALLK